MASKERVFTFTENNGVYTIQSYGAIVSSYKYEYDVCNNLSKLTCSVLSSTWNTVYTYDNDNRPKTTTLNSGKVITNTYDAIGRLSKRTIGLSTPYETRFEYHLNGSNRTPLLHKYYNGSDDPFVYNYDDNGNITSITQGSTSITYKYDVANRLTRENNSILNQTITYEYDYYGNIQSKKTYAYSTGDLTNATYTEIEYEYETDGWNDQLVSYNDQAIEYDNMGNPTSYRGYTFGWRGKQLTSASNGTNSLTFEYNEDGLRQSKTCNNITTDYYYNGSVLIGMQRGQSKFLFSYDAAGNAVSVKFNGTEYYYLRNAQGDIVKLIDANGTSVVEYTYDTWGKKVTTTGTLAGTLGLFQPFRYRGYVYDWETGFYYLQSRYYDPEVGRFISADVLLSTGQGVMGHNCYAYCLGNPVRYKDSKGTEGEETRNGYDPFDFVRRLLERMKKYMEPDQFVYDPSSWNDATYTEFRRDADHIEIAFVGEPKQGSIWAEWTGYYDAGIHINYGGDYSEKLFKRYIEEWGMQKTASNMAQFGIWKYNNKYKEKLKDYPKNWDEEKLAKEILYALISWRDRKYVNDNPFIVSYTD